MATKKKAAPKKAAPKELDSFQKFEKAFNENQKTIDDEDLYLGFEGKGLKRKIVIRNPQIILKDVFNRDEPPTLKELKSDLNRQIDWLIGLLKKSKLK